MRIQGPQGRGRGSPAGPGGRGAGGRWAARARSACGAARARGARSTVRPPARAAGQIMRPSAAHMEPGAGVTARDMRTRSARPARGPQNTGALKGDAARPRPAGRGQAVGGRGLVWWARSAHRYRWKHRPSRPPSMGRPAPCAGFPRGLGRAPVAAPKGRRQLTPRGPAERAAPRADSWRAHC